MTSRKRNIKLFEPLNKNQQIYYNLIDKSDLTVCVGNSGTAKTFIPTMYAAEKVINREKFKIVITRPFVEVGKSMGFLPGTVDEKAQPYLEPILAILRERAASYSHQFDNFQSYYNGTLQIVPIPLIRGMTFDDCIFIIDECQNCTPHEIKTCLTRIGNNCTTIVCGDLNQIDLPEHVPSGFSDFIKRMDEKSGFSYAHNEHNHLYNFNPEKVLDRDVKTSFMAFDEKDIVRSPIVSMIEKLYER